MTPSLLLIELYTSILYCTILGQQIINRNYYLLISTNYDFFLVILSDSKYLRNTRYFSTTTTTVDKNEIEHFQLLATEWWDEFGVMKALHAMNKLRVPFVRDGLINRNMVKKERINSSIPLKGLSILDVGCGGGILTEPLAKLGASVTGLDASASLIKFAESHAKEHQLDIEYYASSIDQHACDNIEKYDALVASEVIEHVTQKKEFIEACVKCLKPSGSIFITTLNKTTLTKVGVFIVEDIMRLIPKGTHQFEKFIEDHKLQCLLQQSNCQTELIHGMVYNIFTNTWHWCSDTSQNYGLQAIKL